VSGREPERAGRAPWLEGGWRRPSPRRRVLLRWLAGLVGFVALLGAIVFAVAASGHEPFASASAASQDTRLEAQVAKVATSIDRLVDVTRTSSSLTSLQAAAAAGDFSQWTARLGPEQKKELASKLAAAFGAHFGGQFAESATPGLTSTFAALLTGSGPEAAKAAGTLLSLASVLPAGQRQLVLNSIGKVLDGAEGELGAKAVDGLYALFGKLVGNEPKPLVVTVEGGGAGTTTIPVTSKVRVFISLAGAEQPSTSFIWFNRTWGRDDRTSFEHEFQIKHSDKKEIARDRMLTALYVCHAIVRRVLGVWEQRPDSVSFCKRS
jgi:hypothetical protein